MTEREIRDLRFEIKERQLALGIAAYRGDTERVDRYKDEIRTMQRRLRMGLAA